MWKKLLSVFLCLCLFTISFININALQDTLPDDGQFHVVNVEKNGDYKIIKSFASYAEAKVSHTLLHKRYHNLGITYGNSFLTIDQGIVSFDVDEACNINSEYTMDGSDQSGYLNGCYGNDAAFLEYNTANNRIKFKISGVVGWIDASKATIYPIESVPSISSFIVKDEVLYHRIKSSALSPTYANSIALSEAPSYLKEDTTYYSFDSHYFYTSYKLMINDYRDHTYLHAVNAKQPYYNYYQYMDHRSTSSYTPKQLNSYFKNTLALNATITDFYDKDNYVHDILTQSLLFQGSEAFFQYQNQFGANALMMLSLSLNESALGRSYLAYSKNNLFGHAAYDSSAQESASRYSSISNSVYSHALHYISSSYLNPKEFQFGGGFFGNKAGGMNISYASDPYWGEKAAQYYYRIDSSMGNKDYNQYALGISNHKNISVYTKASEKSDKLYSFDAQHEASFILLEKVKNKSGVWYRVQSDLALNKKKKPIQDGSYPFKTSYGFVKASDLSTILNETKIKEKHYVTLTFNALDGEFYPDRKTLTMEVENGTMPVVLAPTKDHAEFKGWDIHLEKAKENLTYNAQYRAVKNIEIIEKPQDTYSINDTLNIKNGKLRVNYADGKHKDVMMTTDMISGFDNEKKGKQIISVNYAGCTTRYEIHINDANVKKQQELKERAAYIIKTYSGKTGLNEEAIDDITRFRDEIVKVKTPLLSRDQIRIIDRILQENLSPRYSVIIKDDVYDLQTSGLAIALQGEQNFLNKIMPKTIRIDVDDSISKDETALIEKVAKANDMEIAGYLDIDGSDDGSSLKPKADMVFSIKKPKDDNLHRLYRVYYINGDDVYQLPTSQSDHRILFTADSMGAYALVYQNVDSLVKSDDFEEVNTIAHNGKDYIKTYIILPCAFLLCALLAVVTALLYRKKKHQISNKSKRNHE